MQHFTLKIAIVNRKTKIKEYTKILSENNINRMIVNYVFIFCIF